VTGKMISSPDVLAVFLQRSKAKIVTKQEWEV